MMANSKDIEKVARVLGCRSQTVRYGLKQGAFPFGTAVKCDKEYSYILYPAKVKEYLGVKIGRVEEED